MWANNNATPLPRPEVFAGKETLTDQELAELKQTAADVLDGGDAFFADDFVTAAIADNLAMEGVLKGARADEAARKRGSK